MKMEKYLRHKERIIESYRRKLDALKEMYPEEWKMDHERKQRQYDLCGEVGE